MPTATATARQTARLQDDRAAREACDRSGLATVKTLGASASTQLLPAFSLSLGAEINRFVTRQKQFSDPTSERHRRDAKMGPKHLLLLAAVGSAFLQDADMDYNDEDVTNFFDEVVVPMREAAKEALRPQAVVGPTNASSLQCSADQLTVRILEEILI